jgi:hypothetical protein
MTLSYCKLKTKEVKAAGQGTFLRGKFFPIGIGKIDQRHNCLIGIKNS